MRSREDYYAARAKWIVVFTTPSGKRHFSFWLERDREKMQQTMRERQQAGDEAHVFTASYPPRPNARHRSAWDMRGIRGRR